MYWYEKHGLAFARASVASVHDGRIAELVEVCNRQKFMGVTEELIHSKAEKWARLAEVYDPEKKSCFFCGTAKAGPGHKLCRCFDNVRLGTHHAGTYNNIKALAEKSPHAVIHTYSCKSCGVVSSIAARAALSIAEHNNGEFKPPTHCKSCYSAWKAQRNAARVVTPLSQEEINAALSSGFAKKA